MPITSQVSSGPICLAMCARFSAVGATPPSTPRMKLYWSGRLSAPICEQRLGVVDVAEVEALQLGLHPALVHRLARPARMSQKGLGKTKSKTKPFRFSEYFA